MAATGLVVSTVVSAFAEEQNGFGNWRIQIENDPITDQKTVVMTLDAEAPSTVIFIVQCSEANGVAGVAWRNQFLGGEEIGNFTSKEMRLRIDKGQPFIEQWLVLDDGTTTRIPRVENLMQRVREAERFLVQTTPYNELPVTAVFDVKGLKDALLAHRPECNWFIRDLLWERYQQKLKAVQSSQ